MAVDRGSSVLSDAIKEAIIVSAELTNVTTSGLLGESETGGGSINVNPKRVVDATPSQNVINLQQRAAGVLPVRIDVPRAGTSLQFVRTLVVDEETQVQLDYRRR